MPTRHEFRVPGLNEPISHYTDAVRFGDLLFVSGIGPLAEDGSLVGGDDAAEQTRQIFRNLDRVLRAAGASPADVLKVTVYLTRSDDFAAMNAVYARRFGEHRPARSTVIVAALPKGAPLELDLIARTR